MYALFFFGVKKQSSTYLHLLLDAQPFMTKFLLIELHWKRKTVNLLYVLINKFK